MDVARTIWFCTYFNIRLVIRNTGHDYNGKSSGAGAVGIWVHYMTDITFSDYESPNYQGQALKVGAGVQSIDAYRAADRNGVVVVGGECPTISLAGGYSQGGGHSSLSSKYGLAADQVLEWEVVDGLGQLIIATPQNKSDLYWALSGGGGGTYGVVLSMTSKAHPDIPVTGANLTFSATDGVSQDDFYDAVATFQSSLPALVDNGATLVWFLTNSSFSITPLTAPGLDAGKLNDLLTPLQDKLKQLKIPYGESLVSSEMPPNRR